MHANEREPRGTDISLQTYMHMESRREREGGMKDQGKIQRRERGKEERCRKDRNGRAEGWLLRERDRLEERL